MSSNISIKEAASLLGVSQQMLRVSLQQGLFSFGFAVKIKDSSKYTYYINRQQLNDYIKKE
jgi:hypothetical protein